MTITIRAAGDADAARISVLLGQLGHPAGEARVRARLDDWQGDRRSVLVVAEVAGRVSGVAAFHAMPLLEHDGRRGRLVALVVDESCRGQGVGRALVAHVEREAHRLGCRELEITGNRAREAAHGFYRGLGYDDVCARSARFLKALDRAHAG